MGKYTQLSSFLLNNGIRMICNITVLCLYYLIIQYLLPQNPKSQEPVTLDFLDAELENDIKVEVRLPGFLVPVTACVSLYNN